MTDCDRRHIRKALWQANRRYAIEMSVSQQAMNGKEMTMRTTAQGSRESEERVLDDAELSRCELTDQQVAGVSGGLNTAAYVDGCVSYIRSIVYPNTACSVLGCVRWGWKD